MIVDRLVLQADRPRQRHDQAVVAVDHRHLVRQQPPAATASVPPSACSCRRRGRRAGSPRGRGAPAPRRAAAGSDAPALAMHQFMPHSSSAKAWPAGSGLNGAWPSCTEVRPAACSQRRGPRTRSTLTWKSRSPSSGPSGESAYKVASPRATPGSADWILKLERARCCSVRPRAQAADSVSSAPGRARHQHRHDQAQLGQRLQCGLQVSGSMRDAASGESHRCQGMPALSRSRHPARRLGQADGCRCSTGDAPPFPRHPTWRKASAASALARSILRSSADALRAAHGSEQPDPATRDGPSSPLRGIQALRPRPLSGQVRPGNQRRAINPTSGTELLR